ncbi:hypothetical protein [Streptomyces sp. NPDC021212]|uniref:hypothetical protein n=1 Tax=Streptomyces sp. NPDC021212 TaxID=3365118 RepID=UPI00379F8350
MNENSWCSAVPENLYRYSDACTRGAEELQSWIRTVLAPAISAYNSGGGCSGPLDVDGARKVAAACRTDRDVRATGQAFQQAGAPTARPGRQQQYLVRDKALDVVLKRIQHQARLKAGAALAQRFMEARTFKDQKSLLGALDQHAGDPYFSAGFFNVLEGWQIETVVALDGSKALVSACSTDVLDKKVIGFVAHQLTQSAPTVRFAVSLLYHPMTDLQKVGLLKAFAGNPVAAANFARYVTGDGKALKALLGAEGYPHPRSSGKPSVLQTAAQRAYLSMLSSAVTKMNQAEVQRLLLAMGADESAKGGPKPGNFPMISAADLDAIMPDLKNFMRAGAAAMVSPMPSQAELRNGSTLLQEWVKKFGARMHAFDGLYDGIVLAYQKDGAKQSKIRDVIIDAGFAAGFAFPPEALMSLGVRGVGGAIISGFNEDRVKDIAKPWILKSLEKNSKSADPAEIAKYTNMHVGIYLISRMVYNRKGMVVDKFEWPDLNAPDGMQRLLTVMRDGDHSVDWVAMSGWPAERKINGGDAKNLSVLLDAYISAVATKATPVTLPDRLPSNSIWRLSVK